MLASKLTSGHTTEPPLALFLIWVAAVLGSIHAGFSFYWAFGGSWLLEFIGEGAISFTRDQPVQAWLLLFFVGLFKVAAAWIPLLTFYGLLPFARAWRATAWVGSVFLIAYASLYLGLSAMQLAGEITTGQPIDRNGLIGHAFIWDPLFLLWGLALHLALIVSAVSRSKRLRHETGASTI